VKLLLDAVLKSVTPWQALAAHALPASQLEGAEGGGPRQLIVPDRLLDDARACARAGTAAAGRLPSKSTYRSAEPVSRMTLNS